MKIAIAYPPLESEKGTPLLSQNRQFQWFTDKKTAYFIYPVVPATAATMLKNAGFKVYWLDYIAEKKTYRQFLNSVKKIKPDLIAFEVKTPVVKRYWQIIKDLKKTNRKMKIVLMGDHVTALPKESLENSPVDYILTGGDFDFLLLNLAKYLQTKDKVKLEPGFYWKKKGKIKSTGRFNLAHDLNQTPIIDRKLTKWQLYAYKNSNFKKYPGTYIMAGRDCWWGKCTFCSWTTLFPGEKYRVRSVDNVLKEINHLVENLKVKEIMDDSGTFPVGDWLREFCRKMIKRGLNKKVTIDCNMRFNCGLSLSDYQLMKKAGFRFILYGLESANQKTLDKINKNLKVKQIKEGIKKAKQAGLEPHYTVMVGYPWENKKDTQRTLDLAKKLFKKGYADSMQATIVIPYPGTPLFKDCKKNKWLLTEDWDDYDMRSAIMKSPVGEKELKVMVQKLYSSFITPEFIIRKILSIRSWEDVKTYFIMALKYFGKLSDFSKKNK